MNFWRIIMHPDFKLVATCNEKFKQTKVSQVEKLQNEKLQNKSLHSFKRFSKCGIKFFTSHTHIKL